MEHDSRCITRDPDWVRKFGVDRTPTDQCPHCVWLKYYKRSWDTSILLFGLFVLAAVIWFSVK